MTHILHLQVTEKSADSFSNRGLEGGACLRPTPHPPQSDGQNFLPLITDGAALPSSLKNVKFQFSTECGRGEGEGGHLWSQFPSSCR